MKLAVKKDGHYFCTHINQVVFDLVKPLPQPQDKETNGRKGTDGIPTPDSRPVWTFKMIFDPVV